MMEKTDLLLKTSEIVELARAIDDIQKSGIPVLFRTAFAFDVNKGRIENIAQAAFTANQGLIERHATKDEDGKPVITNGNYEISDATAYTEELTALLKVEVEVEIQTIDYEDVEGMQIKAAFAPWLKPMIRNWPSAKPSQTTPKPSGAKGSSRR